MGVKGIKEKDADAVARCLVVSPVTFVVSKFYIGDHGAIRGRSKKKKIVGLKKNSNLKERKKNQKNMLSIHHLEIQVC